MSKRVIYEVKRENSIRIDACPYGINILYWGEGKKKEYFITMRKDNKIERN